MKHSTETNIQPTADASRFVFDHYECACVNSAAETAWASICDSDNRWQNLDSEEQVNFAVWCAREGIL